MHINIHIHIFIYIYNRGSHINITAPDALVPCVGRWLATIGWIYTHTHTIVHVHICIYLYTYIDIEIFIYVANFFSIKWIIFFWYHLFSRIENGLMRKCHLKRTAIFTNPNFTLSNIVQRIKKCYDWSSIISSSLITHVSGYWILVPKKNM